MSVDLTPEAWGKAILEDILFRAAREIALADDPAEGVVLSIEVRVKADRDSRSVTIAAPGAVEPLLVTRVRLDECGLNA